MSKVLKWIKTNIIDDEYEMHALVCFGILLPFILIVLVITILAVL